MKVGTGFLGASWGRLGGLLGRLGGLLGPSWRSLVRLKTHAKIDRKSDASWNRFWKDFNEFSNEKSRHVGTKIEQKSMPTSKSDFFKKRCFSPGKTMILSVQGIEVGRKNR